MQSHWDQRDLRTGGKPVHGGKTVFLDLVSALQGHGTGKTSRSAIPYGNTDIVSPLEFPAAKEQTCYCKSATLVVGN